MLHNLVFQFQVQFKFKKFPFMWLHYLCIKMYCLLIKGTMRPIQPEAFLRLQNSKFKLLISLRCCLKFNIIDIESYKIYSIAEDNFLWENKNVDQDLDNPWDNPVRYPQQNGYVKVIRSTFTLLKVQQFQNKNWFSDEEYRESYSIVSKFFHNLKNMSLMTFL